MKNNVEIEQGFYQAVAELLDCSRHIYNEFPYRYKTRWNNRLPGNGRYPDHGLVRRYSSTCIHVHLNNPVINGHFKSADDALQAIKVAMLSFIL
jgi:hypothetical protein